MYHFEGSVRVMDLPVLGGLFSGAAPLDLKAGELALVLFDQINFFLVIRAPEVGVSAKPKVRLPFHAFGDHIVFTKVPRIIANGQRIEVADEGIADAIVTEVIPMTLGNLFA